MQSNKQKQKLKRFWRQRFVLSFGCLALVGIATTQVPFLQEQLSLQEKLQRIEALEEKQQSFQRLSKKLQELQKKPNLDVQQYIQDHRGNLSEAKAAVALLDMVRQKVEQQSGGEEKINAMIELASVYGQLEDLNPAARLLQKALNQVSRYPYADAKGDLLRSIAQACVELDDSSTALMLFPQIFKQVVQILESDDYYLFDTSATSEIDGIVAASLSLQDADVTLQILQNILEQSDTLSDEQAHYSALTSVAYAAGQLKNKKAGLTLLSRIQEQVKNLSSTYDANKFSRNYAARTLSMKADTLRTIAHASGQLGDVQKAKIFLQQSLLKSDTVSEESSKVEELQKIAWSAGNLGDTSIAMIFIGQVLQQSDNVIDESSKTSIWGTVAYISGEAEDPQIAEEILPLLLQKSKTLSDESIKAGALVSIASASGKLDNSGFSSLLLKQILQQAQNTSNTLSEESRDRIEQSVIYAWRELGDITEIVAILRQELQQIENLSDESMKAQRLGEIALILEGLDEVEIVIPLLQQVLQKTKALPNGSGKNDTLMKLASSFGKVGKADIAIQLVQELFQQTEYVTEGSEKFELYETVTLVAGKLENPDASIKILEQALRQLDNYRDRDKSEKAGEIVQIAQAYSQIGNHNKALMLLKKALRQSRNFDYESDRPYLFSEIASTFSQDGPLKERIVVDKLSELIQTPNLQGRLIPKPKGIDFGQALFSLLLPSFFAFMLLGILLTRRNPVSLSLTGQLIIAFPEECVAELETLKQRMKIERCPQYIICLRMIQETLELFWAFYLRIRLDNLRLLHKEKKIDD